MRCLLARGRTTGSAPPPSPTCADGSLACPSAPASPVPRPGGTFSTPGSARTLPGVAFATAGRAWAAPGVAFATTASPLELGRGTAPMTLTESLDEEEDEGGKCASEYSGPGTTCEAVHPRQANPTPRTHSHIHPSRCRDARVATQGTASSPGFTRRTSLSPLRPRGTRMQRITRTLRVHVDGPHGRNWPTVTGTLDICSKISPWPESTPPLVPVYRDQGRTLMLVAAMGYLRVVAVQRSSHSSTVACQRREFWGLRTQWFSSGK